MEERDQTILIVRYHDACRVLPPHKYVYKGDQITFRTIKTAATILIPNPQLFTTGQQSINIDPGKDVTLTVGDPGSGVYPYAVFCDATNDFALGGSSPDLIVY